MIEESTILVKATGRKVMTESLSRNSIGKFPLELQAELIVGLDGSPPLAGEGYRFFLYLAEYRFGWYHEINLSSQFGMEGFLVFLVMVTVLARC